MSRSIDRRAFLRGSLVTGAAATGFVGLEEHLFKSAVAGGLPPVDRQLNLPGPMPMGRIGNLSISRLVCGGNLIGGWAHARDLLYVSSLMQAYNTEERRFDTFELLEQGGVNTVQVDVTQVDQINQYKKSRGGQLQVISSVRPLWGLWNRPQWDEIKEAIDRLVDQGVALIYIHGGYADQLVHAGILRGTTENVEYIGRILDYIREKGFPAGLGSHAIEVPRACDQAGIEPDFYFKTFHNDDYWSANPTDRRPPFSVDAIRSTNHGDVHDNIFDLHPQETLAYMRDKPQPWFAFKCLAAGAIKPAEGLDFAYRNGADFVVLGMFDFQVQEDLTLAIQSVAGAEERERPWCA